MSFTNESQLDFPGGEEQTKDEAPSKSFEYGHVLNETAVLHALFGENTLIVASDASDEPIHEQIHQLKNSRLNYVRLVVEVVDGRIQDIYHLLNTKEVKDGTMLELESRDDSLYSKLIGLKIFMKKPKNKYKYY